MKKLSLILFLFFISSLLVAQEKGNVKSTTAVKSKAAKNIDAVQGAIKNNSTADVAVYDFTVAGAAYTTGPAAMVIVDNVNGEDVYAMIAGDANGDGAIDATDQNAEWRPNNGQPWDYSIGADMNLDGSIDATDLNAYWRPNNGKSTQVPN